MSRAEDPDEVDRRFAELVRTEFGEGSHPAAPSLDDLDPEPEEDWSNDADYRALDESPTSWTPLTVLGFLLSAGGTVLALSALFGLPLPGWTPAIAATALVSGVALLLVVALRHRGSEVDDQGARL